MKRHPLQTNPNYTFVCVSDITEEFREHNDVLYNPGLPYDKRRAMFLRMFQKNFNNTSNFTTADVDTICNEVHDMNHVIDLIREKLGYE